MRPSGESTRLAGFFGIKEIEDELIESYSQGHEAAPPLPVGASARAVQS